MWWWIILGIVIGLCLARDDVEQRVHAHLAAEKQKKAEAERAEERERKARAEEREREPEWWEDIE